MSQSLFLCFNADFVLQVYTHLLCVLILDLFIILRLFKSMKVLYIIYSIGKNKIFFPFQFIFNIYWISLEDQLIVWSIGLPYLVHFLFFFVSIIWPVFLIAIKLL